MFFCDLSVFPLHGEIHLGIEEIVTNTSFDQIRLQGWSLIFPAHPEEFILTSLEFFAGLIYPGDTRGLESPAFE